MGPFTYDVITEGGCKFPKNDGCNLKNKITQESKKLYTRSENSFFKGGFTESKTFLGVYQFLERFYITKAHQICIFKKKIAQILPYD